MCHGVLFQTICFVARVEKRLPRLALVLHNGNTIIPAF
jgi:hypothetical protein